MLRVISSSSAAARISAARRFVAEYPPAAEIVIVSASRGAADDFVRGIAKDEGATFGLTRLSLIELAARAAAVRLGAGRRAPATMAGSEAAAARAAFDAAAAGDLEYFAPVASLPGFPRALARTLHELRLAGVRSPQVAGGAAQRDIGRLLARVEQDLDKASLSDRAQLLRLATDACATDEVRWIGQPLVLLDVPLDSVMERSFAAALVARAPECLATVPDGDQRTRVALEALPKAVLDVHADTAAAGSDLAHLRQYVFVRERPPERSRTGDVRLFSAPGEGREAVEIVRRVLDEAARGVRFDEMAVFLRAPQHYQGLLEHACDRGGVPAYFERGTSRPDPSGRAFVALLSCAAEGLSARRFDEYLSLGQVPVVGAGGSVRSGRSGRSGGSGGSGGSGREAILPKREEFPSLFPDESDNREPPPEDPGPDEPAIDSDEDAVIAGTLRAPWRWEELVVESAVIGGRDRAEGRERWRRRLAGLAADYRIRRAELTREEPESPRIARLDRDLINLEHLRAFALPIIDRMAGWPEAATWGEWIDLFLALARVALRRPDRVLESLAELRPMASVGPVGLEEARDVLHARLISLDREPPLRRYGSLFVGTPHDARGRTFKVVFVPGLAERIVPQRPREDPLLLDERRQAVSPDLIGQDDRAAAERLMLRLAIGAAEERLYLSYPRLDVAEARARVPSFYALDVIRAITGVVPDHRMLATEAADEAGAHLAWPAPADPDRAIDDLEHDLATLKPLLDTRDPASVKGHAHYLLALNDSLRRSVISRWSRGRPAWSPSDGLVQSTPPVAAALHAHRLGNRPYSLSALQRYAQCPYQFLLASIHRLQPFEEPEPIVRMDPLTRGSLFHEVQARFYRELHGQGALPVTAATVNEAVHTMDGVLKQVAGEYQEKLAPAIQRVWDDEIRDLRRDLVIWVQKMPARGNWQPEYFEFSFGLNDEGRDSRSVPKPVHVDGRFFLRGSVDLIEQIPGQQVLRVTDHKTGKNRSNPDLIVGGGAVLQPVLYSAAVEQALGQRVLSGRLYYCTTAGGFVEHEIAITDPVRQRGLEVLEVIDRAVGEAFLVAAPAERACNWCDFRPVCGPREEERVARKKADRLADLTALRDLP